MNCYKKECFIVYNVLILHPEKLALVAFLEKRVFEEPLKKIIPKSKVINLILYIINFLLTKPLN